MTEDMLKDYAHRIAQELLTQGDLAVVSELYDPTCAQRGSPALEPGIEGVKQWVETLRCGFPDLSAIIEVDIAERDRVVQILTLTGTHHGPFLGIPPTGRQARWPIAIALQAGPGDRFVSQWSIWDHSDVRRQLGATPRSLLDARHRSN